MDTSQQGTVIPKDKGIGVGPQRQRRSIAEKRRIVEETLVPGTSVARVGAGKRRQREPGVWLASTVRGGKPWGAEARDQVAAGKGKRG